LNKNFKTSHLFLNFNAVIFQDRGLFKINKTPILWGFGADFIIL